MSSMVLKKGESSDVINFKVSINNEVQSLTNYTCKYVIINKEGEIVQSIYPITEALGVFPFRLLPVQTSLLEIGNYTICIQIENLITKFNRESNILLSITSQCIV